MRRAGLAIAALLVGCAARSSDVERQRAAIIGGSDDASDPAVVAIVNDVIGTYCTGTLIAPRVVLTAGHCLELNADAAVFGSDAKTGTRVAVVATQKHPKYTAEGADFDLGVVVLEHDVAGISPVSTNHAPLDASLVGTSVRHVGFGTTIEGTSTGTGTKHVVSTPIVSIDAARIVSGTATANTCIADSGAPAFVTLGGNEVFAGVVSDGPDCHSPGWDDRIDPAEISAWIDALVADDGASLAPVSDAGTDADAGPPPPSSSGCDHARTAPRSPFSLFVAWLALTALRVRAARRNRSPAPSARCRAD